MIQQKNDIAAAWLSQMQGFVPPNTLGQARRQEAQQLLQTLEIPTPKHEEWKYTPLNALGKVAFQYTMHPSPNVLPQATALAPLQIVGLEAHTLVFVDGFFQPQLSAIQALPKGVVLTALSQAQEAQQAAFATVWGQLANPAQDWFAAFNLAYATDGLLLHLPAGKIIEQPIRLLHLQTTTEQASAVQLRHVVIAEENSQCTIVEQYHSLGKHDTFVGVVAEFDVKSQAVVHHLKLQNDQAHSHQVSTTQARQAANSQFTNTTLTLDGGLVRNQLNLTLEGAHCEGNMFGLYMLKGQTLADNHTTVDHQQPNTLSNEFYKGVLDERSKGVFNGKIFVRQAAQKTNAYQQNRNILLSDNATINTKPQLEIWADDVKCSHGATTGSLDEDALFYMRARGVDKAAAKALLTFAFANEVIQKINQKAIRQYLAALVAERLGLVAEDL
jgi:Fe-S cluster assembly protein SufD